MNSIKVDVIEYLNYDNSCFLCLQSLPLSIEIDEEINPTKLVFEYLKISNDTKPFVCQKCIENLAKFLKLCDVLEKVKLEMDYVLDSIKKTVEGSKRANLNSGLASAREMVEEKCKEKMKKRKLQIILERLDISEIKKEKREASTPDSSNDYLATFENECPATPDISEIIDIKYEINLEQAIVAKNAQIRDMASEKVFNTFATTENLEGHNAQHQTQPLPVISVIMPEANPSFKITSAFKYPPNYKKDGKRWKCDKDDCHYTKNRHSDYSYHQLRHENIKNVSCKLCHKKFVKQGEVNHHVRVFHLKLKPFKCPYCGKPFAQSSDVKRHDKCCPKKNQGNGKSKN